MGTHEQGVKAETRGGGLGSAPSPYFGEGPGAGLESPRPLRPRLQPFPSGPWPRPLLPRPSFPKPRPSSVSPPYTYSRLPASAAKFLRLRPRRARAAPQRRPAVPSPRAHPGPGPAPAPRHAVWPLEEPPAPGVPGAGPGRGVCRALAPTRTPGRRHQEARAAGAEKDGSVTGGGGSGGPGCSGESLVGSPGCMGLWGVW